VNRHVWTRRRIIGLTVVVVAAVIVLLVSFGLGWISLPGSQLTISSVHWTVEQGTTPSGSGWFGPSEFNFTAANGYPKQVAAGGQFTVTWLFENFDSANHTIYSILAGSPFIIRSASPTLPALIPGGSDSAEIQLTVGTPTGAGSSWVLDLTVDALTPLSG